MIDRARHRINRPLAAGVVLLAIYVGLSFLNSTHGYLGTDTGGKVATLEAMSRSGTFEPDVGYWAAEWDPDGSLHPLYYTSHTGDQYINVTTLPMVLLGRPLYELGGYRLALLLPMLGSVATAFAARALARRLGTGDGMSAFWIVGLASPLTVYALDFWEHSIGVALLAWGVVALLSALRRLHWWQGLAAGVAFGAAFTLRTEALVYAFVATGTVCCLLLYRRTLLAPVVVGAGVIAGMALPIFSNQAVESRLLGDALRTSRAAGAATTTGGGSSLSFRVREGLVTTFSFRESNAWAAVMLGVLLVALLAYVTFRSRGSVDDADGRIIRVVGAVVVAIFLWRFVGDGLGFVPGFLMATPLAAVALVEGWRDTTSRVVMAVALLALPLVWAFQFSGGAVPQWAGRYVLCGSLLLLVVGVVNLPRLARGVAVLMITLSMAVSALGVAWLGVRSREIDDVRHSLASRPEPALISTVSFWLRELGPEALDHRWLSTDSLTGAQRAAQVVAQAGIREFALLQLDDGREPPAFDGWRSGAEDRDIWFGTTFRIVTYDLA